MRKKLTNSVVEGFTGDGTAALNPVLWDTDIKGFGLRYAMRSRTRTYILTFRVRGSKTGQTITIGRHNDPYRIDQARAEALRLKSAMLDGVNPVAERKAAAAEAEKNAEVDKAQTATLRQVMLDYIENKRTKHGPLRPKTKISLRTTVERYLAAWLDKPMAATVTRDACLVRFTELSDNEVNRKTGAKGKKIAATQTFMYLRALCNYARDRYEDKDGTPRIFTVNPVTRMTKVRKLNPIKPRKDRIPKDRVGHVWNELQKLAAGSRTDAERTACDWVSTMMTTGMRLSESAALKRTQVDLEAKTLRLFGDVVDEGDGYAGVKNHHDVVLPLSTALHEILSARLNAPEDNSPAARRRKRERSTEYLFPSFGKKRPYINDARATLEAVSTVATVRVSPHTLRRTFEDVLRYAKVDPDERRLLLNHISGDVHQVSYSNSEDHETLRGAMQAAADWITTQARIATVPNVIPFPAKTG